MSPGNPIIMSSMCRPQEMTEVRERRRNLLRRSRERNELCEKPSIAIAGLFMSGFAEGHITSSRLLLLNRRILVLPTAPVIYAAQPGEDVVISGGRSLSLRWIPYKNEIMKASVPTGLNFTQMFVNGKRQIRARYPNYDPSQPGKSGYLQAEGSIPHDTPDPYAGSDADMTFSGQAPRGVRFDPATFTTKRWSNPTDAEINIFQEAYWGNLQWRLKGIDYTTHSIWFGEGGQQIGAKWDKNPAIVGGRSRYFIENVFEELDSPGEWFLDHRAEYSLLLPGTWD